MTLMRISSFDHATISIIEFDACFSSKALAYSMGSYKLLPIILRPHLSVLGKHSRCSAV